MKRFVVGDIHGCYSKLRDVLDKAEFQPDEDILYSLGDLCDRGKQNKEVLDYLVSLPHFEGVFGNHDVWVKSYIEALLDEGYMNQAASRCWRGNGGKSTIDDLSECSKGTLRQYLDLLRKLRYRIELDNCILQHNPVPNRWISDRASSVNIDEITLGNYGNKQFNIDEVYDEELWGRFITRIFHYPKSSEAQGYVGENRKLILCGHTPVVDTLELKLFNIIDIDTGAFIGETFPSYYYGWLEDGKLTAVNLDSGEAYQSGVNSSQTLW